MEVEVCGAAIPVIVIVIVIFYVVRSLFGKGED